MKKLKGFTLIELLVVVAIIGILATVVVVNLSSSQNKARISKVKSDISEISNAAELVLLDTATFSGNSAALNTTTTIATVKYLEYASLGVTPAIAGTTALSANQGLLCKVTADAQKQLLPTAIAATSFKSADGSQLIPSIPAHPSGRYTVAGTSPAQTATGYGIFWMGQNGGDVLPANGGTTTTTYSVFAPDPSNLTSNIYYCTTGRACSADTTAATTKVAL